MDTTHLAADATIPDNHDQPTQPTQPNVIHLDAHVCATRHNYRVIFEGPHAETMALVYLRLRGRTHAFHEVDDHLIDPDRYPRLFERLYPTCPHGLSEWLCEHPINHYPPDL